MGFCAATTSFEDRPFGCPPNVVLDVPVPPSVNKTRNVSWVGHRDYVAWKKEAGWTIRANGQYAKAWRNIHQYELTITLDEKQCKRDPGNIEKAASDFLKFMEIIVDDAPKFARRITIEWGEAPSGCRLTVKPLGGIA